MCSQPYFHAEALTEDSIKMDENRVQAYQKLIETLLQCSSGEESQILQANSEFVDEGLVQMMQQVAQKILAKGYRNGSWLSHYAIEIAYNLGMVAAKPQEYLQFLRQLRYTMSESPGNLQAVYLLLQANIDKLDDGFAQILQTWVIRTLSKVEFHQAKSLTANLVDLGNFMREFSLGNKANNMEIAIVSYCNALQFYTREAFPLEWAGILNNLANACRERIRGDQAKNREKAIIYHQNALQVFTRETSPFVWANIQNDLAHAYLYRIRGDRAANLENAIKFYNNAMQIYICEDLPQYWAMTQRNLAVALHTRILGEKAENLEDAIALYENALKVHTREAFPDEWAGLLSDLAITYRNRIWGKKAENLEQAIKLYQNALRVYTRNSFPTDWARTQNNLAVAYQCRIIGDTADNLEQAINCLQNALKIRTREAFPVEWAETQNNLAVAYFYLSRIQGEKAKNLEQAIKSYQNALQIYTRQAFPQDHTKTLFSLGLTYQDAQQWQQAYQTFSDAINTVESLREEILSGDESKQKLAEEYNQIYQCMVETCLQLNKPIEALEYAERSKTRNLVEQILLKDSDSIFPQDVAAKLAKLRDEINSAQYQIQQGTVNNYQELAQRLQNLRQQRNQLQDQYLPVGSSFEFNAFQQTLNHETAVIEWYLTEKTFLAYIISKNNSPVVWQSTSDEFDSLVEWINNYLKNYYTERDTRHNLMTDSWQTDDLDGGWGNDFKDGRKRCAPTLQNLADILHLDQLLEYLPAACQQLILIPHRFLHLFPLHALPVENSHPETEASYLLDIFPKGVRYAPSCQLLQQMQTRQHLDFNNLFAIQTPTPDLYEEYEKDLGAVGAIKKQFSHANILRKDKATKAALLPVDAATQTLSQNPHLQTANCLFFFCHGYFNPNSPLDSGLQLADENLILAEIIAHFRLENCRLVTLSACETGIPDFKNISDEYISLPYGFLLAGSTNVVSSLWQVDATATALLMMKFYQELQQQDNITIALRTAQFWLRNTTVEGFQIWLSQSQLSLLWQGELRKYFESQKQEMGATARLYHSPDYWAAFCIVGKGE